MSRFDLEAIDELCRLVLVARRLGCDVQFGNVDPDLRAAIDLAGVGDLIVDAPSSLAPPPGTGTMTPPSGPGGEGTRVIG